MSSPAISVIIPAYNAEAYLAEAIQSIIDQLFTDWELIIVDDGSGDETATIAESFAKQDGRIRLLQQTNQGETRARLAGLKEAKGDFIYFLDADDRAFPGALPTLRQGFDRYADAVVCYGAIQRVDAAGDPIDGVVVAQLSGAVLEELLTRNFMAIGAGLIRKSALDEQALDHGIKIGGDLMMWSQLASIGSFYPVTDQPVMAYRFHDSNVSRRMMDQPTAYTEHVEWIFSYPPTVEALSEANLHRLKAHRLGVAKRYLIKQALLAGKRQAARSALTVSGWRDFMLLLMSFLPTIPDFLAKRLR